MAITLHSFQRYLTPVCTMALGTDTFPMDMVAELRWASMLAKITEQNYQVGQLGDVCERRHLGACTFLGRDDLGRLAPGAEPIYCSSTSTISAPAFYADPIKALVDFGYGR